MSSACELPRHLLQVVAIREPITPAATGNDGGGVGQRQLAHVLRVRGIAGEDQRRDISLWRGHRQHHRAVGAADHFAPPQYFQFGLGPLGREVDRQTLAAAGAASSESMSAGCSTVPRAIEVWKLKRR
jgi:hypothetical protein